MERGRVAAGLGLAILAGGPAVVASAAPAAEPPVEFTDEEVSSAGSSGDYVTVEELTEDGTVLSTATLDADGHRVVVDADGTVRRLATRSSSGDEGTPSASGCRKVTVHNEMENELGSTAYWYNTWTSWCWNRAAGQVTDVRKDFWFENDGYHYYRGQVNARFEHYEWRSGYNKSGYWAERQAEVENCILRYGCISVSYPRNILRSHSDGTWSWRTDG